MNARNTVINKALLHTENFPKDKLHDDGNGEEYVNDDLGPPSKKLSVKESTKLTDNDEEEGYVNDDMGPPEKVHINITMTVILMQHSQSPS